METNLFFKFDRIRDSIVSGLIEKGLGAARTSTKQKVIIFRFKYQFSKTISF